MALFVIDRSISFDFYKCKPLFSMHANQEIVPLLFLAQAWRKEFRWSHTLDALLYLTISHQDSLPGKKLLGGYVSLNSLPGAGDDCKSINAELINGGQLRVLFFLLMSKIRQACVRFDHLVHPDGSP